MTDTFNSTEDTDSPKITLGKKLKTTRENLGLTQNQIAVNLKLTEHIVSSLECDSLPSDIPITFLRGYLKSYAKLLKISEHEVNHALNGVLLQESKKCYNVLPVLDPSPSASPFFTRFFSYLMLVILIGLTGAWWYSKSPVELQSSGIAKTEKTLVHGTFNSSLTDIFKAFANAVKPYTVAVKKTAEKALLAANKMINNSSKPDEDDKNTQED